MVEIDPITGLPKELSVWENITKQDQQILVELEKRKFGKQYTVIKGLNDKEIDAKELTKKLKNKFACGGSFKSDTVELQGDHRHKMKEFLIAQGFAEQTIIVK
ncbi:MAG: stress response translation initiation inhibitor YciH [Candidatus Woesearchaeota archaeon]